MTNTFGTLIETELFVYHNFHWLSVAKI